MPQETKITKYSDMSPQEKFKAGGRLPGGHGICLCGGLAKPTDWKPPQGYEYQLRSFECYVCGKVIYVFMSGKRIDSVDSAVWRVIQEEEKRQEAARLAAVEAVKKGQSEMDPDTSSV